VGKYPKTHRGGFFMMKQASPEKWTELINDFHPSFPESVTMFLNKTLKQQYL
jgi:hypothetical protein